MTIKYQIKDSDTIQHIANNLYKDASLWKLIASYNNLDFPYITSKQDFIKEVKSSGKVRLYVKEPLQSSVIINKGTILYCDENPDKKYLTLSEFIFEQGSLNLDIDVECVFPGLWGNVRAGAINMIDNQDLVSLNMKVYNALAFVNGYIYNVKKTGEILLIPDIDGLSTQNYFVGQDNIDIIGGEDLFLDNGDLNTNMYGDLSSSVGSENIANSLKHRLETEKGELIYHPEYGCNLSNVIGITDTNVNKKEMVILEIKETLFQDDRINKVDISEVVILQDKIFVECNIQLITGESLKFVVDR